ncbi:MAG TPA: hypothetical protein VJ974_07145 [Geopsychrobacteraceae bacterium]|nr:hypothetical protein [Geopsychrobacteraceae bacterium]
MESKPTKLGEMLLQAGLIDQFQLDSALSYHRNVGGRIGTALVKLGYIPEEKILEFLAKQSQFPRVDLHAVDIPRTVLSMIPVAKLYKCMVLPLELKMDGAGKMLVVAMTDPTNLFLIDDLQFMAGCRVSPVVAAEAEILSALNRYFPGGMPIAASVPALSTLEHNRQTIINYNDDRFDRLVALLHTKGILSQREVDRLK